MQGSATLEVLQPCTQLKTKWCTGMCAYLHLSGDLVGASKGGAEGEGHKPVGGYGQS